MSSSHSESPKFSRVPPNIARAPRTYGRRRDTVNADSSSTLADTNYISRDNLGSSIFSGKDEALLPSSDDHDASNASNITFAGDEEEEDEGDTSAPHFQFAWQKKLLNWDDDAAETEQVSGSLTTSHTLDVDDPGTSSHEPICESPLDRAGELSSDGAFNGPLPILTSSSQSSRNPSSPAVLRPVRRRLQYLSDSEREDGPSSPRSSPHNDISTPKSRSSPTPPTSLGTSPKKRVVKSKSKSLDLVVEPHSPNASTYSSQEQDTVKHGKRKSVGKGKRKGLKAPTKKERLETQKATARIAAERAVSIPRGQERQIPVTALWQGLASNLSIQAISGQNSRTPIPGSDPIQSFSSPPGLVRSDVDGEIRSPSPSPISRVPARNRSSSHQPENVFVSTGLLGFAGPSAVLPDATDSDDAEMPTIGSLLQKDKDKRLEQEHKRRAMELKQRALAKQQLVNMDDSGSDLEVVEGDMQMVAKEEAQHRRAQKGRSSLGRRKQLALAGPVHKGNAIARISAGDGSALHVLEAAAAPSFMPQAKGAKDKTVVKLSQGDLNRMLLHTAEKRAEEIIKEKEVEWVRRGGKIKGRLNEEVDGERAKQVFQDLISKGLSVAQRREREDGGQHAESSDEEYHPIDLDDDAHGEPQDEGSEVAGAHVDGSDHADDEGEDSAVPFDVSNHADDEDDEEQKTYDRIRRRPIHPRPRPIAAIESDEDDDAQPLSPLQLRGKLLVPDSSFASSPPPLVRIEASALRHRSSLSSFDDRTEDGTDKENDVRLSFDRGEDKENTAVAPQSPPILRLSRTTSLLFGPESQGSPSVLPPQLSQDEVRTPFKELIAEEDEDDPFAFRTEPRPLARRLEPDSPSDGSVLQPGFALKPASSSADLSPAVPSALNASGGFSQFFTQNKDGGRLDRLRKLDDAEDLALTLDVGLQPALDVHGSLLQKADAIFEKEQEFLVAQQERPPESKHQFYVNANGFLTQTVQNLVSPGFNLSSPYSSARSPPPSSPGTTVAPSTQRRPLQSLFDADIDDADGYPRRRLVKRLTTSPNTGSPKMRKRSLSPSPSRPKNAFDLIQHRPHYGYRQNANVGRRLGKSEFIEGEAEESDDDAMIGFGGRKKEDDEESNDDDQDRTLAELVDDRELDEKTLGEEAVLEKVREHQEADDRALEKIHLDAVEGKYRTKRRDRGVGFEDSDSDDDDDEARRLRRGAIHKKRRIDGDTLEELAKDKETQAFVEAYHADMIDGDEEFAHLQADAMDLDNEDQRQSSDEQEEITADQLREQLREASRQEVIEEFNPRDVSWVDNIVEDDDIPPVKEVPIVTNKQSGQAGGSGNRVDGENEEIRARMQSWARSERMSRTVGAGRSAGGSAAVTGHSKRQAAGAAIAHGKPGSSSGVRKSARLAKAPSALSAVSNKRTRFDD
ncbi:hypothetical protein A0H81_04027 [Grifola frondosa]|uniref:DNA replication checkpoint mediator MRC1 domain-containing protein n=1 Tax=Grifola frondosa TaxID=5627 RepID=A0A1C7MIC5_GRIFR|nr:hypothetical protein A0H81_04027 [Grifola frondosa]